MFRRLSCRLGKALVVSDGPSVTAATLSAVAAAAKCGPVSLFVYGDKASAEAAAKVKGVAEVFYPANAAKYKDGLSEAVAPLVESVAKAGGFTHIVAPATSSGRNIAPRLAALLDVMPVADVMGIVTEDSFVRGTYAGNAVTEVKSKDAVKVLTVRTANFSPAEASGGSASATEVADPPNLDAAAKANFVEDVVAKNDKPDLLTAKVIVSGGRGLQNKETFHQLLEPLAANLNAGIGATRAVVDAGWCPYDWQIGQTGKVVAPGCYIAVGISGAIQHVAGMKDSKVIACINKDAEAPIFGISDYGLVDDCLKAVPTITSLTKK